jgi:dephospho-CoA kinase
MEKQRVVIGLVGETGSGKDTVANYLREKYVAKLLRFVDPINEALGVFFEKYSKQDQQWLVTEFRKRYGNDILCRALEKKIRKERDILILNGVRLLEDEKFMKDLENSHIIYITADQRLRWERIYNRGEKLDDHASFEKFQEIERAVTEVNIPEIGSRADFLIRNEKDLPTLLKFVDEVMEKIIK